MKIKERAALYALESTVQAGAGPQEGQNANGPHRDAERERVLEDTLRSWQQHWRDKITFGWIPSIREWVGRGHGALTYHLTQALTGHGCFNEFRHRIGKVACGACWYGCGEIDTAEHTLCACKKWDNKRRELAVTLRVGRVTVREMGRKMLEGIEEWEAIAKYVTDIIREKEELGKEILCYFQFWSFPVT
ncbi:uncharacterized protein LOC143350686 [Colletes latitarsis]|uniref:uncharacterized protein LOC143350685 n=1 Tax=Colletes latitarsis TaxID=2605962 RepID=UPI004035EA9F